MGHINVSAKSEAQLAARLMLLANLLPEAAFDELEPYVAAYQANLN